MRSVFHSQLNLGEEDIAKIKLDPKSRDDIPQLLAGLQYIYTHADAVSYTHLTLPTIYSV